MLDIVNETDCSVGLYAGWNENRQSQMTCVIKKSFSFDLSGLVKSLASQTEIIEGDEFYGEPHKSSLKSVNEIAPYKLGGETYLFGTAYPDSNKYAMEVEYNIVFLDGKRWNKKLRVTGMRTWNKILLGYVMSKPQLLQATKLKYENAYGGFNPQNEKENFIYNPVGKGFNKASGWKVMNLELPSIEIGPKFLSSPPQQQLPAGFSPIPQFWEPRNKDLGEIHESPDEQGGCPYTDKTKASVHNVAPLDQRFSTVFHGGEKIILRGFFENAPVTRNVEFEIPKFEVMSTLVLNDKVTRLISKFDTLIIDTDKFEFYIISRVGIPWDKLDTRNAWVIISQSESSELVVDNKNVQRIA
ncbi:hypothetical protein MNBD_GAMMA22-537 [hydrothermal vent metagenome]|uniref:DUF2169 domain-containing protein n=1 Tax=hydrothermal vent metagenome TaxID=652676 RepID=A0A3B0ZZN4_9ZZZZ